MARIRIKPDGAILLGASVSCDGFAWDCPVRVQTHIHADHMLDFDTSKANQTIVTSSPTLALLYGLYNADLPHRSNLIGLDYGMGLTVNGDVLRLLPSNHMLGCAQVCVTCCDGYRVGYSSDFYWPLDEAIRVDELLVDATYGEPGSTRNFTQQLVDEKLVSAVLGSEAAGKLTAVVGHNGRLQYALHILGQLLRVPIICSPKAFALVDVYRQHGYAIPMVLASDSDEGLEVLRSRQPCVAFITFHERRHLPWTDRFVKIALSAHMANRDDPVLRYDNGDCCIALTDHADFDGTVAYIRATGARLVWTDPRSGNAEALAVAVRERLGIECRTVERIVSLAWG